ncbi:MAG TPA: hypothetical protein VJ814_11115, partial [Gaiellaceae bacterium]|nr:hypothetical protein [Gaiellaceae bacterium]
MRQGRRTEARSSALWGKRGGRTLTVATVLALTLALPAVGAAGATKQDPAAVVDATLLAQAKAHDKQLFSIVIQGASGTTSAQLEQELARYKSGAVTNGYAALDSVAATLAGKDVVKLGSDPLVAGITVDTTLHVASYQNDEIWRQAEGFAPLYTRPAVTCTSKQKNCVPSAAYTAPQAPAIAIVDSGIDP